MRTIYRTLSEIVAPSHTCLVAWDFLDAWLDRCFNRDEIISSEKNFMDSARSHGIPLVYSRIVSLPRHFESPFAIYKQMKAAGVDDPEKLPAPQEFHINSRLAPQEHDFIIEKHTFSIFNGTYFEILARNMGIETIIFTGLSTEKGVETSARDASARGFYTVVASDCVSSADKELHDAALKTLGQGGVCIVESSANIISAWSSLVERPEQIGSVGRMERPQPERSAR
jgi:nicotinamidase-related amidase